MSRAILRIIKIRRWALNAFNVLYSNNQGSSAVGGQFSWSFAVNRQGCPPSGTSFVIPIDPLLTLFGNSIHNPRFGAIFVGAADIGAALSAIRHLIKLHNLFCRMRRAAWLTLELSRCYIFARMRIILIFCGDGLVTIFQSGLDAKFAIMPSTSALSWGQNLGGSNLRHLWTSLLQGGTEKEEEGHEHKQQGTEGAHSPGSA